MMARPLEFNGVKWSAISINDEQVDALCVNGPKRVFVLAVQNFAERDLPHRSPVWTFLRKDLVDATQQTSLWLVQQRSPLEISVHNDLQLISCQLGRIFR